MLTAEELAAIGSQVSEQAKAAINKELAQTGLKIGALEAKIAELGGKAAPAEDLAALKNTLTESLGTINDILKTQGTSLAEISLKISGGTGVEKSIGETLEADTEELKSIWKQRTGSKSYMLRMNEKGQMVMRAFDETSKATGPVASVAGLVTGAAASISQAIDAATLLRLGAGSPINSQYRNTAWLFDLCNTINGSYDGSRPFAMWFDEQPKAGASTTVTEGATKPLTQYIYALKTATYKKEATLVGFTQEFQLDFAQLESDIMNKARIDVINRVNSAILPDIQAAATAWSIGGFGNLVGNANYFDAIAAVAAQVDTATFGAKTNVAIMSTYRKYRMGLLKSTYGTYLNPPAVLDGVAFVGNAAMAADALIAGDLKQFNILLRGGLIVRVGYNGTDFANNMYSVVIEQYYYDYISTVRAVSIVSTLFATVMTAIN